MTLKEAKAYYGHCPICNEAMVKTYDDYLDGWCLMEYITECPNEHYEMYYFTGNYLETIGNFEFSPMSDNRLYLWWFDHSRWWYLLKEKIKWRLNQIKSLLN